MSSFKLKRFSDEKQDQIEQLIAYASLLGLSGRDLVSIGGKMDRESRKADGVKNMELISSLQVYKIGKDSDTERRFKIKTPNGAFNFENNFWNEWTITSLKTGVRIQHRTDNDVVFPKSSYNKLHFRQMLYDIAVGKIVLNF